MSRAQPVYDVEARNAILGADRAGELKWRSELDNRTLYEGSIDYVHLTNLKDALIELRGKYFDLDSDLSVKGPNADEARRRLQLIEKEVEGLMKRRIDVHTKDHVHGERVLNYSLLLSAKEAEIIQLETRIKNLEAREQQYGEERFELHKKIADLQQQGYRAQGWSGNQLEEIMRKQRQIDEKSRQIEALQRSFQTVVGAWQLQLNEIRSKYPNQSWRMDQSVIDKLRSHRLQAFNFKDFAFVEVHSKQSVNYIQDDKTKELILLFAQNLKRLTQKYPKLTQEIDQKIQIYFKEHLVQAIECGSLERLVEIVKIVPQTVKVQNVYEYTSSKSRKAEFHLRILLKALLEQVAKAKEKTGVTLDIDEGVIGMINKEIMDIVSVDDILKVYRGAPKIVEVEKIVDRIVQKTVEVPKYVTIEQQKAKVVQTKETQILEQTINHIVDKIKPVECIVQKIVPQKTIEQKLISINNVVEKVVEIVRQKQKLVQMDKIVQKVVKDVIIKEIQKQKIVELRTQVPKQVPKPVIFPGQREIIEKIVEVPTLVDKIVLKPTVETKIVEVEVQKQKIVQVIRYEKVTDSDIAIKEVIKEVPVIKQILVKEPTTITQIKEVQKRIQVQVPVRQIIERPVQVKVPGETIVIQKEVIKEVKVCQQVHVPERCQQKIKIVEKRVNVPIIHQKLITVELQIEKPLIQRVHIPHIVPIKCIQEKIVTRDIPKIIREEVPYPQQKLKIVELQIEKIVPVERIVDRIKPVQVKVQKIVNKIVQVPKLQPVQVIVQKIVPVPRVIQTIVQVPQIIQKIVQKEIIQERIVQVQKIREKCVTIPQPQIRYYNKEIPIYEQVPVDKIIQVPVQTLKVQEKEVAVPFKEQVLRTQTKEKLKEVQVDKLVPYAVEQTKVQHLKQDKIIKVCQPKIIEVKHERPVYLEHVVPTVEHCVTTVDKLIEVPGPHTVEYREKEVCRDKVVQVKNPEIHQEIKHVIQKVIEPVQVAKTKVVPVPLPPQHQIHQIDRNIQKATIARTIHESGKGIQIQKVLPICQQTLVKQILKQGHISTEHKTAIAHIDKFVELRTIDKDLQVVNRNIEKLQTEKCIQEKIVPVCEKEEIPVEVKDVEIVKDIIRDIVDKPIPVLIPEPPPPPCIIPVVEEVIKTVPQFQEKIVERIVVMPQIVQIVKHVTQICQTQSLVSGVSVDIEKQQTLFKQTYGVTKRQLEIVITELNKVRSRVPQVDAQIKILHQFLVDFDKLAAIQRIVPVEREKIVEKEVPQPILIPTKDSKLIREELSLTLLIQKLVGQLKRIKKVNPNVNLQLDNEVGLFFFSEFFGKADINQAGNFKQQLEGYTSEAMKKLNRWNWQVKSDQQLFLNTMIQDRFTLVETVREANQQIQSLQDAYKAIKGFFSQVQNQFLPIAKNIGQKQKIIKDKLKLMQSEHPQIKHWNAMNSLVEAIDDLSFINIVPMSIIDNKFQFSTGSDQFRVLSKLREMQLAYEALIKLFDKEVCPMPGSIIEPDGAPEIEKYIRQLMTLTNQNKKLISEKDVLNRQLDQKTGTINHLNGQIKKVSTQSRTLLSQIAALQEKLDKSQSLPRPGQYNQSQQIRSLKEKIRKDGQTHLNTIKTLGEKNLQIERLRNDIEYLKNQQVFNEQNQKLIQENQKLTQEKKKLNDQYAQLMGKWGQSNRQLKIAQDKIYQLESRLQGQYNQSQQIRRLKAKLAEDEKTHLNTIEALREKNYQLKILRQDYERLKSQQGSNQQNEKLIQENQKLNQDNKKWEDQYAQLMGKWGQSNRQLQMAKGRIQELQARLNAKDIASSRATQGKLAQSNYSSGSASSNNNNLSARNYFQSYASSNEQSRVSSESKPSVSYGQPTMSNYTSSYQPNYRPSSGQGSEVSSTQQAIQRYSASTTAQGPTYATSTYTSNIGTEGVTRLGGGVKTFGSGVNLSGSGMRTSGVANTTNTSGTGAGTTSSQTKKESSSKLPYHFQTK